MAVNVRIPTPLRKLTADKETVHASGGNIQAIVDDLEKPLLGGPDGNVILRY